MAAALNTGGPDFDAHPVGSYGPLTNNFNIDSTMCTLASGRSAPYRQVVRELVEEHERGIADQLFNPNQPLLVKKEDWARVHPEWMILGAGGFGAVMHAYCGPQVGHVAIKLMPRAYPQLMQVCNGAPDIWPTTSADGAHSGYNCPVGEIEFKINAEMDAFNPNIGRAHGAYFGQQYVAIVTPGYMQQEGWVVLEDLKIASAYDKMQIALQLTRAVKSMHARNTAHNDVKPANIMWNTQTKVLKLIDLGSASTLSEPMMYATVNYIPVNMRSPTLLAALGESSRADFDVYAVGMTVWMVLASTNAEIATAVASDVHAQIEEARAQNPDGDYSFAEKQGPQQTITGMSWHPGTPHRYGMYALFAAVKNAEKWQIQALEAKRDTAIQDTYGFGPIQDVWGELLATEYHDGYGGFTATFEEEWNQILGAFYGSELQLVEKVLPAAVTLNNSKRLGIDALLTLLESAARGQEITDEMMAAYVPQGPGVFGTVFSWLWALVKVALLLGVPVAVVVFIIRQRKGGDKAVQIAILEMQHTYPLEEFCHV